LSRDFIKEDIQIAQQVLRRCSMSLGKSRPKQPWDTTSHPLGGNDQKKEVLGRCRKQWSPQTWVGMKNCAAVTEQFGSSSKQKTQNMRIQGRCLNEKLVHDIYSSVIQNDTKVETTHVFTNS
jgi:hypothetical protein